jgi:hypothetical protein
MKVWEESETRLSNYVHQFSTVVVSYDENEEFVTAAYRCQNGYRIEGKSEITCDLDTDEWLQNPPKCQPGI